VGGKRAKQGALALLLVLAAVPVIIAAPVTATDEQMCAPFTASDLYARHSGSSATTTTEVVTGIDPIEAGEGRAPVAVSGVDPVQASRARGSTDTIPDETGADPTTTTTMATTGTHSGGGQSSDQRGCTPYVYDMVSPLVGAGEFGSGFGAPRDGGARLHMGVDLMAPQMTPVVAIADGTVVTTALGGKLSGTYVKIQHDDGFFSLYIHLNNDDFGTDDGAGIGVRPGLKEGDHVKAGEVIGWVGDSGNAETTPHHLHFEIHLPSNEPFDPWPSVQAAMSKPPEGIASEASDVEQVLVGDTGVLDLLAARVEETSGPSKFQGPFVDDDNSPAQTAFGTLTALGVPTWCDDYGLHVCPDAPATGGDAEAWVAALGTGRDPSVAIEYSGPALDLSLDRSTAASCGTAFLCTTAPVTYGEAAAMLIGTRDGVSVLSPQEATATLAQMGLAGCNGPQNPNRIVTRAELAELALTVFGFDSPDYCGPLS
jgi:murein DD-endopeptidase MepM/ murein hydrolase activator NlpD